MVLIKRSSSFIKYTRTSVLLTCIRKLTPIASNHIAPNTSRLHTVPFSAKQKGKEQREELRTDTVWRKRASLPEANATCWKLIKKAGPSAIGPFPWDVSFVAANRKFDWTSPLVWLDAPLVPFSVFSIKDRTEPRWPSRCWPCPPLSMFVYLIFLPYPESSAAFTIGRHLSKHVNAI